MTYTAPSTKTLDRDHPLMVAQRELENEAIGRGTERYYAALEKSGEQNMPAGMLLIKRTVLPLAEAIKKWVEEARAGLALSKSSVSSFLQQFQMDDYQGCAWLVASSVIAMADSKHENTMQATAIELASRLEDMLNFDALRKADPRIYKILQQKISLQLKADRRHVVLHVYQKKAQVAEIRWGKQEKVRLGTVMLNLMEGLGIIQCVKLIKSGTNTPVVVQLTPEIESWLYDKNAKCALLSPRLMPMVVPPVPWDSIKGGGYYHHKLKKPLIKTYNHNYLEEMNNKEMPMVYKAINTLQETAWAVNSSVFTVMQQVWESGSTLGKLPPRFGAEIPPKTFVDGEADPDQLLAWKRVAAATHDQNIRDRAKRKSMSEKLWLAEKMGEFNRFYFTYTIDSRGRCYPAAEALSPQGDDSAKALLRFADTVSLGEEGRYWLAVHGANTFGYDKASFDARAAWTVENEEKILESAANPLDGSRWWADAAAYSGAINATSPQGKAAAEKMSKDPKFQADLEDTIKSSVMSLYDRNKPVIKANANEWFGGSIFRNANTVDATAAAYETTNYLKGLVAANPSMSKQAIDEAAQAHAASRYTYVDGVGIVPIPVGTAGKATTEAIGSYVSRVKKQLGTDNDVTLIEHGNGKYVAAEQKNGMIVRVLGGEMSFNDLTKDYKLKSVFTPQEQQEYASFQQRLTSGKVTGEDLSANQTLIAKARSIGALPQRLEHKISSIRQDEWNRLSEAQLKLNLGAPAMSANGIEGASRGVAQQFLKQANLTAALITTGEAVRLTAYTDPNSSAGKNIGMGYNLNANAATIEADFRRAGIPVERIPDIKAGRASITEQQAMGLLVAVLPRYQQKAADAVNEIRPNSWKTLSEGQKAVLTDVQWQVGDVSQFKTALHALLAGDMDKFNSSIKVKYRASATSPYQEDTRRNSLRSAALAGADSFIRVLSR